MLLFLPSALSATEVPPYHALDVAASLRKTNTAPGGGGVACKRKSEPNSNTLLRANVSSSYERRLEETLRRDAVRVRGLEQQIERRLWAMSCRGKLRGVRGRCRVGGRRVIDANRRGNADEGAPNIFREPKGYQVGGKLSLRY
jgi:hypothetical protein